MKSRIVISVLLLLGICLPFFFIPSAHTQSNATTTMTIQQPSPGGCTMLPLAFTAHANDEIRGTFGSDAPINFYILSQDDFNAIQNCRLPASVRPLFIEENIGGVGNTYRALIHVDGTYYFVFTFIRSTSPAELASGYATVILSYPPSVNLTGPTASSTVASLTENITSTAPSTSTANSTSISVSAPVTSTTESVQTTIAAPMADYTPYMILGGIGATIAVIFTMMLFMKRRGRASPAPTPSTLPPPQGTPPPPTTPPATSQPKTSVAPAPRPSVTPVPPPPPSLRTAPQVSSQVRTRYTPEQVMGMVRDIITRYKAGQIDKTSFKQLLIEHVFKDAYGRWWTINVKTGKWVQRTDGRWVEAEPPPWLEK